MTHADRDAVARLRSFLNNHDIAGTDCDLGDDELARYIHAAKLGRGGRRLSWLVLAADAIRADRASYVPADGLATANSASITRGSNCLPAPSISRRTVSGSDSAAR